jgi:[ribosomal protein S18]-alanine N-acetyltransferase
VSPVLAVVSGNDADLLAQLHAQCFEAPWGADAMRDLLATPGTFGLVAAWADDAPPAGFVLARVAADESEILSIGVAPEGRGKGLGAALLEAAALRCAKLGARTLFLEVAADNRPAQALYARAGFRQAGLRKGYYARAQGPGVDGLALAKTLVGTGP